MIAKHLILPNGSINDNEVSHHPMIWIFLFSGGLRFSNLYAKHIGIWSFSGPYFPAFGLNTQIDTINLVSEFKNKYQKILTKRNSVFEHFLAVNTIRVLKIKNKTLLI